MTGNIQPEGLNSSFRSRQAGWVTVLLITGVMSLHAGGNADSFNVSSPVFSPDGRQVAFVINRGDKKYELAVVPAGGGDYAVIALFEDKLELAGWFPDGGSVAVTIRHNPDEIWRIQIADKQKIKLVQGDNPRISPDGKTMAFTVEGCLHLLDLASGSIKTAGDNSGKGCSPGDWLDSEALALLTSDGSVATIGAKTPQAAAVVVPHKSMFNSFVSMAVDRSRKIYALVSDDFQAADQNSKSSIWIYDRTGKQLKEPIMLSALHPAWSAQGTLFFSRKNKIFKTTDFSSFIFLTEAESWAVNPGGTMLVVVRRDSDTNGDGVIDWRDGSNLYTLRMDDKGIHDKVMLVNGGGSNPSDTGKYTIEKQNPISGIKPMPLLTRDGFEYGVRSAVIQMLDNAPRIDGVLDDACWKKAVQIGDLVSMDSIKLGYQTRVYAAFDDANLYFAIRAEHPDPSNIVCKCGPDKRDGPVWVDESVELFIDPEHSHQCYYQFINNPAGSVFDDFTKIIISEKLKIVGDRISLLEKCKSDVNSTWNTTGAFAGAREAYAWTLEGRIPYADLKVDPPESGAQWGFNITRTDKSSGASCLSSWVPIKEGSFTSPRYFGHIAFINQNLFLSNIVWGAGYGKCRLTGVVSCPGEIKQPLEMKIVFAADGKTNELASIEKKATAGKQEPFEIIYNIPEGVTKGKLILIVGSGGKPVCSRTHYFELSEPMEIIICEDMISTRSKNIKLAAHLKVGEESLKQMRLSVNVVNLSTFKSYAGTVSPLAANGLMIFLDAGVIGVGKGRISITLMAADTTLCEKSISFEIVEDPFASE